MGKLSRLASGLLVASGLASCAGLDIRPVTKPMAPAPVSQYTVGDKFVFKVAIVEDRQEIVAVDETTVNMKSSMFGTLTQYKDFTNPESWTGGLTQAYSTKQDRVVSGLFLLKVGNRVSGTGSFTYNSTGTYVRTCTVEDQLLVTVPVGGFETYQVGCNMKYTYPSGTNLEVDRIWYSPEINHWVATNRHARVFVLLSYDKK